jgi:glycosyltransferase involved in cell wall biosynthesis
MRILAVNWRDRQDPMGGGAEVHLHELLRRLVDYGHEVTWLACSWPGAAAEEVRDDGIRYRRAGHWAVANFVLPRLMKDELRRREYDVIVEDINKIPFFTPRHTRLPVLAVVPHLFGGTVFRETNPFFGAYVWLSERPIPRVYRDCRFMAISESTRDDLVSRGIDVGRIEVIHCGMDHGRYLRDDPPSRGADPRIIHLGRLRRYKSVDVVVRAMRKIRDVFPTATLQVVGDGPDEARLRGLVRKLNLTEAVNFLGYLPRDEIVDELYRTHLFLNPSPKEGWGLTVIEANECGVPVVASRRPGLQDSVREGETGYLAEYGNHEDFADKALTLLTDPPLWRVMSENAVRWARGFSWDDAARRTEALLEDCLR